ncbi:MAG: family 1 glycosylhydrolase, partial [Fervidobacterium sp.]
LIDACLERNIQPNITIYHWDLPQALETQGGWTKRDTYLHFLDYVDFVTKEYADKVPRWFILNEPSAFTILGYLLGIHAPGRKGLSNFLPAVYHVALAQGEGGKIAKSNSPRSEVGTTFFTMHLEPFSKDGFWKELDQKATSRYDALINRLFIEPLLGLGFPYDTLPFLRRFQNYYQSGDEEKMTFIPDFIGIQNYTREIVKSSILIPYMWGRLMGAKSRTTQITEMGWEIYPEGIYYVLKRFAKYDKVKKIYI